MSVSTLSIACGGFSFLLLPFQYLVGWGEINLVISMNLFHFQNIESYQRCAKKLGVSCRVQVPVG